MEVGFIEKEEVENDMLMYRDYYTTYEVLLCLPYATQPKMTCSRLLDPICFKRKDHAYFA